MPAAFAIDEFEFISLSRINPQTTKRIVREVKAGVDGTTFWNTGKRGEPFSILSVVNVLNLDDAADLFKSYQDLKDGFEPVDFTWAGVAATPMKLMILDVDVIEHGMYATLLGIGGVDPSPSNAMLRCRWDVEAVALF